MMKSCKTIIGTVIIEIEKGTGLGEIHQVLVDEGMLLSNHPLTFVVKSKQENQPYALLPGRNIHGIGDFAVMVENSSALQEIDEVALQALNDKQGAVFDEMVITIDGNKIGRVVDYHIDDQHEIGFLIVQPEDASADIQIPKSRILMVGKEYIILNEEKAMSVVAAQPELAAFQAAPVAAQPVVQVVKEEVVAPVAEPVVSQALVEKAVEVAETPALDPVKEEVAPLVEIVVDETEPEKVEPAVTAADPVPVPAEVAETSKTESFEDVLADESFDLDAMLAELYANQNAISPKETATEAEVTTEAVDAEADDFVAQATSQANLTAEPVEESPAPETSRKMSLEEAFGAVSSVAKEDVIASPVEKTAEKQETASNNRVVPITYLTNEAAGSTFLNEQKRLLLGKKLQKDLVSTDGNTVLYSGDTVTDETIDLLRRIDRKLLVRLAECVV